MDDATHGLEEVTEVKLLLILLLSKKCNPIYLDEMWKENKAA